MTQHVCQLESLPETGHTEGCKNQKGRGIEPPIRAYIISIYHIYHVYIYIIYIYTIRIYIYIYHIYIYTIYIYIYKPEGKVRNLSLERRKHELGCIRYSSSREKCSFRCLSPLQYWDMYRLTDSCFFTSQLMLSQHTHYHSVQQPLQIPNIPQQSFAGPRASMNKFAEFAMRPLHCGYIANICRPCLAGTATSYITYIHPMYIYIYGYVWEPSTPPHLGHINPAFTPPSFNPQGRYPSSS